MNILLITFSLFFSSCNETPKTNKDITSSSKHLITISDSVTQLSNNIMVIYQDKKNNYWFGSWQDGLYKYDGKSIVHFTTKQGLPSNRVEEIKEDELGNVYINTSKGIVKYSENQFSALKETNEDLNQWGLAPNDLWFKNFTNGQYFYRYDGTVLHRLHMPKNKIGEEWIRKNPTSPLSPYAIYCTYKDSKGNIWFGTSVAGVFRYNGKSFDWISESDVNEMHNGPANGVRSIIEDKDGYFWFNTEYKYNIYNKPTSTKSVKASTLFYDRVKSIGCLDGKKEGDLNEYQSIIKDDEDNLWIAIYLSGVWKVEGEIIKHYPIQVNNKNVPIFYLYKDNTGEIWLGTEKNGAWKFNGESFIRFKL
ncbi:MAG: two-component regulator propeller domain-containing protein [Saprospiraceae bacterium]|nr:two-component regulator propeller domain-containing protein [Saprospiraceae bacterium]